MGKWKVSEFALQALYKLHILQNMSAAYQNLTAEDYTYRINSFNSKAKSSQ